MALLDHKCHFVLAEFENLVSSLARIHLSPLEFSAARRGSARRGGHPFCRSPFFSLPRARLPTSAFLSVLPSSLCIPWGITRPSVHHVSSLSLTRGVNSLLLPRQSFYGFPRREDGRANSFKSRCGARNSANPLRIHRAPLANSSLAPNIFLSAHPFTAHRARVNDRLRLSRFPLLPHPISCFPIGPFSQLSDSCRPFLATRLRIFAQMFLPRTKRGRNRNRNRNRRFPISEI